MVILTLNCSLDRIHLGSYELPSVIGHLDGRELEVKPAYFGRFFVFPIKKYVVECEYGNESKEFAQTSG